MPDQLQYELDTRDHILAANKAWDFFADENGAEHLFREAVIGKSLYDFICDPITQGLYRDLHSAIRQRQRPLDFVFRCDSPECRRSLSMRIEPGPGRQLLVSTCLLDIEVRAEAHPPIFACVQAPRVIPRCSICGRIRYQDQMMELNEALALGLVLDVGKSLQVYYHVCPDCERDLQARKQGLLKVRQES